ncbi:MAG: tetratricopeptide repeat protein [Gemmataceae bacterium]|nr:tetratricopeptide repeat protein [Gemmataceae bacterium]MCS7270441.1 tetratricopeptide repeat protein [Gemmataceae bacterium]MDW8242771.1 tetratricopeptide repeat protein [Thermogemmata sp.]
MSRTPRMEQLEALLREDPDDPFLRYGLAMEYAALGEDDQCVERLIDLIRRPAGPPYIPAYLQAGQALIRLHRYEQARQILQEGIAAAQAAGDWHAAGEMQGFLDSIC